MAKCNHTIKQRDEAVMDLCPLCLQAEVDMDKEIYDRLHIDFCNRGVEVEELKKDKSHLEDIESDLNNTLSFVQRGVDIWKEKAEQSQAEVERLKALCLRESGVLTEALRRKHNKSMIAVVAASLKEQALKGK